MLRAFVRLAAALPQAIDRLWLTWALAEIDPLHPDVNYIVHRLSNLERKST